MSLAQKPYKVPRCSSIWLICRKGLLDNAMHLEYTVLLIIFQEYSGRQLVRRVSVVAIIATYFWRFIIPVKRSITILPL